MSYVTAVILLFDLTSEEDERQLIDELNASPVFEYTGQFALITNHAGGKKHPQLEIAAAGFNFLRIDDLLSTLRTFDWKKYDVAWAQVAIQDEHDEGCGLVEVYRDYGSPWSLDKYNAASRIRWLV